MPLIIYLCIFPYLAAQVELRMLLLERVSTTAVFTLLYTSIGTSCPFFR